MATTTPKTCDLDFCTKAGGLVCTACKSARYCCRDHQRQAWPMHRTECRQLAAHLGLKGRLTSDEPSDAAAGCRQLSEFDPPSKASELASAGLLEAVVSAVVRHGEREGVATDGCAALRNLCAATDEAGCARKERAVEAGAFEAVVPALLVHTANTAVQEHGCGALRNLCIGGDEGVVERRAPAARAGALEAVVGAARVASAQALQRLQLQARRRIV